VTLTGSIQVDGGDATESMDGGGSGGTIYIALNKIKGNPGGHLSAKGGDTVIGEAIGGGGSGGRIKMFYYNWFNLTYYDQMTTGFNGS